MQDLKLVKNNAWDKIHQTGIYLANTWSGSNFVMAKVRSKSTHKKHFRKPICHINKPEESTNVKQEYQRIACVFQGGGALGAYQVGAFKAIKNVAICLIFLLAYQSEQLTAQ